MLKHFTRLKSISHNNVEKYVETVKTVENSRKPRLPRANHFEVVNAYVLPPSKRLKFLQKA
jgi:hypothetical protein